MMASAFELAIKFYEKSNDIFFKNKSNED